MTTTRIGLVADTHDTFCDWPSVFARIRPAFAGVDMVLHCGDLNTEACLDDLEALAPVAATRSDGDPEAVPPRLADGPRVVASGNFRIGLSFSRPALEDFGEPVDAVVFGGTHAASVEESGGVLWVNPGSPSLSKAPSVAVLTLGDGAPRAEVIPLA